MKYGSLERTVNAQFCTSGEKTYRKSDTVSVTKLPFELFLCAAQGSFSVRFDGEKTDIEEGGAALIPYDTEYTLHVSAGSRIIYAAIGLCVYVNLRIFSLFDVPRRFAGPDAKQILKLCSEINALAIEREFTNSRLENAVKLNGDVYRLGSITLGASVPKSTHGDIMTRHEKLSPVFMYIEDNLCGNIMQSELSDILEMSPDAFYRFFKNLIGVSPKDFIISEKLRAACEMLVMTSQPIGEISKTMGYDNQLYFSALFRKKYGVCPTEYKRLTTRII